MAGVLFLALLAGRAAMGQVNILNNSSFEVGLWSGGQNFVDPGNATALFSNTSTIGSWETHNGSTWVEDAARAVNGDRMLWIGPPQAGSELCTIYNTPVFSAGDAALHLIAGNRYNVSINFAFFDPADPMASSGEDSTLQIYYLLGSNALGDDPFSKVSLRNLQGEVAAWSSGLGGSGSLWNLASAEFDVPDITGYDYLKLYFSAPANTVATPSRGVLLDQASLSLVPEPDSLLLTVLGLLGMLSRRR